MRPRRPPLVALAAAALLAAAAASFVAAAGAQPGDAVGLFRSGRYEEARQALAGQQPAPGSSTGLVSLLLVEDPLQALQAIRVGLRGNPSESAQLRLRLEGGWIDYARSRPQEALGWLEPLLEKGRDLPGEVHLLAGMAYRALAQTQRAREELAAIKPADPSFAWARYHLGNIALEADDPALALRYFESADRSDLAERLPLLLAGRWQALRQQGQGAQAEALAARIEREFPGSMAAMIVAEAEAVEAPPLRAAPEEPAGRAPGAVSPAASGRYALQLAAFGDRGRALSYLARWQEQLPDLQMFEDEDQEGRVLYRVRLGPFPTRAEAQAAADRLRRAHGLEVLVTEAR